MDITRELLENTRWQCQDGTKLPITEMKDSHLNNSIKMVERIGESGSYSHVLLCAERTYRAAERSQDKDTKGQMTMNLSVKPTVIQADVEPPQSIMRVGFMDLDRLMDFLDRMALKHHDCIFDEHDEFEDW